MLDVARIHVPRARCEVRRGKANVASLDGEAPVVRDEEGEAPEPGAQEHRPHGDERAVRAFEWFVGVGFDLVRFELGGVGDEYPDGQHGQYRTAVRLGDQEEERGRHERTRSDRMREILGDDLFTTLLGLLDV